jgi:hypothetical protein
MFITLSRGQFAYPVEIEHFLYVVSLFGQTKYLTPN